MFHRSPRRLWWRNPCRVGAHTRRLGGITRFYTPDPAFNAPPSDHFLGRQGGEENSSRYFEIHEDEMREAWAEWDGTNLCQNHLVGIAGCSGESGARCKIKCLPVPPPPTPPPPPAAAPKSVWNAKCPLLSTMLSAQWCLLSRRPRRKQRRKYTRQGW